MVEVQCPSCHKVHRTPDSIIGRHVRCNDCGMTFIVGREGGGGEEAPPPAPQAEAAEGEAAVPQVLAAAVRPATVRSQLPKAAAVASVLIAGLAGLAGLFVFAVAPLLAPPGLPKWTRPFVARGVREVRFDDYARMRRAGEADLEAVDKLAAGPAATKLKGEDVEAVFHAAADGADVTAILTNKALALPDLADYDDDDLAEHEGRPYARYAPRRAAARYACRAGRKLFCVTAGPKAEEAMKAVIERLAGRERVELPDELAAVIDYVATESRFEGRVSGASGPEATWLATGEGRSKGVHPRHRLMTVFRNERQAEAQHREWRDALERKSQRYDRALSKASDAQRPKILAAKARNDGYSPSASGTVARQHGRWDLDEYRRILDMPEATEDQIDKAIRSGEDLARRLGGD
jgi:hypothetical protein